MTISNRFSKQLRKNSTEPEKILWHHLRNRSFLGYKFRRQFTVGSYIVDFICLEQNLVIELDGSEHLESDALEYDKKRTEFLNNRGLRVLRFYNTDIFNNIDTVLECIRESLVSPSSGFQPPSPPKGEGCGQDELNRNTFTPKGEGCGQDELNLNTFTPKGEGCGQDELNRNTFTPKGEGLGINTQTPRPKGERDEFLSECNEIRNSGEGFGNILSPEQKLTFTSKHQLRNRAKETRSKLDIEALSKKLVRKLKQTEEYKQAKNIMIFYPLKDEVNLLSLLEDADKTFYLPKIEGDNLLCCKYSKGEPLCESCFHTMEPVETNIFTPDLVIAPALAVDKNNYRLGYGKGFYDRLLAKIKAKTIVCISKELIVETIYPEEFDIPVDKVIAV